MNNDDLKRCSRCKIDKNKVEFHKEATNLDGLRYDCRTCKNSNGRKWYKNNTQRVRDKERKPSSRLSKRNTDLKRRFGITLDDYENLLLYQNRKCAICRSDNPKVTKSFHVDHDHSSGQVRGLLCQQCNVGLGHFRDSVDTLYRAIQYLAFWKIEHGVE